MWPIGDRCGVHPESASFSPTFASGQPSALIKTTSSAHIAVSSDKPLAFVYASETHWKATSDSKDTGLKYRTLPRPERQAWSSFCCAAHPSSS